MKGFFAISAFLFGLSWSQAGLGKEFSCDNPPPAAINIEAGRRVVDQPAALAAALNANLIAGRTCFDVSYSPPCKKSSGPWSHAKGSNGRCFSMYSGQGSACISRPGQMRENDRLGSLSNFVSDEAVLAARSRGLEPSLTCIGREYSPDPSGNCLQDADDPINGRRWIHGKANGSCFSMYGANGKDFLASAPTESGSPVRVLAGSQTKICQLVGGNRRSGKSHDHDWQKGFLTLNETARRFGVLRTDLGMSFEHKGKLFFLWGDTTNTLGLDEPDSISYSETTLASLKRGYRHPDGKVRSCIKMDFVTNSSRQFNPISVPGVSMDAFGVPTGGFSYLGNIYAFVTHAEFSPLRGLNDMVRSHLAVSENDGGSFRELFQMSRITDRFPEVSGKFINVAPVKVNPANWGEKLPDSSGKAILMMGSGEYRKSRPYLAYLHLDNLGSRRSVRFFAGLDSEQQPIWSRFETDAKALFRDPIMEDGTGGIGELSFQFIDELKKWAVIYNRRNPEVGLNARISIRFADSPFGPWGKPQELFNKEMGREAGYIDRLGGNYGPYLISRLTEKLAGDRVRIYYTLSTWKPYTVVLMSTILKADN